MHEGEQASDAVLKHEAAHLRRAFQPALDVAGAPVGEVGHGQRKQLYGDEIEQRRIDPQCSEAEEILLQEGRDLAEDDGRAHRKDDDLHELEIVFDDDLVDHDLVEDGEEKLEKAHDQRERERDAQDAAQLVKERGEPRKRTLSDRRVLEIGGEVEQRGIAGPLLLELRAQDAADSQRGIGHAYAALSNLQKDDPVVALPVDDRGKGHGVQIPHRDFQGARGEAELGRGAAQIVEARAVEGGGAELADA